MADTVVVMDYGRIIEADRPDIIFQQPRHERTRSFLQAVLSKGPMEAGAS
jgi:polar amino acid transport system ATP-binding protein